MERKFRYWLAAEEGQPVKFGDLAHLMAKALHPSEEESFDYACARLNLEKELPDAVDAGTLIVRNASGLGVHTFPVGEALRQAVVLPWELRPFLAARGIELRETPHGSGPKYWTLSNAATAIAEQEGWHNGARGALLDSMMEAAQHELTIRDPLTGLPKTSGTVREFWETVTPADVNAWLEKQDAPYRWNVAQPTGYEEWLASSEADDEARQDPVYQAVYLEASELLEEIDKLERMDHRGIPSEAKLKEETLLRLKAKLASLQGKNWTGTVDADALDEGPQTTRNIWDEYALRRLLDESRMAGSTHEKLAAQYGVKRQFIGRMLKKAKEQFERPRTAAWTAPMSRTGSK